MSQSAAVSSVSHPVLVVNKHFTQLQCPVSQWVKNTLIPGPTDWGAVCAYERPLMSIKFVGLFAPIVLVPVASLLGSPGSPCSLSHDDLRCTCIHTYWCQLPADYLFTWTLSITQNFRIKKKKIDKKIRSFVRQIRLLNEKVNLNCS